MEGNSIYDVVIVGAGPAGAAAAQLLAPRFRTLLLEKSAPPRYKTCGGGILPRALALLGHADLPPVEQDCYTAEFHLSDSLHFSITRAQPIVRMAMRADFDYWLLQKAIAAGTQFCDRCAVENITVESSFMRLGTTRGEFRTRYVIAADGARSLVAKRTGFPEQRLLVPALECEMVVGAGDFERFQKAARFDFQIVRQGYAWVFPKKERLSVGVLTFDSRGTNLNQALERYLVHLGVTPLSVERHGYVIPLLPRGDVLARQRVLLTGDAAGLADPLTAEGITHAILSGQLAARAILRNFPHVDLVTGAYNRSVREEIFPELRRARLLARLVYSPSRIRDSLFQRQGARLTRAMAQIITGDSTYGSLLSDPRNYLKLIFSK